jgi:ABC-type transporter Mla subunit MlaD
MAMSAGEASVGVPRSQRLSIGANVAIAILLAAGVLAAVNAICSMKYFRRDIAATGNYGLSDRTKSILNSFKGEIKVSTLYMPSDENDKQRGYIQRLQDYCDELQRFDPNVKVSYVTSPMQREKLVAQISQTFGGEAGKHKEALDAFASLHADLKSELEQRLAECRKLMEAESWLGDFPVFANIVTTLKSDNETLHKAADEIKELTPAGGIPKFGEATSKAKSTVNDVKTHLQAIAKKLAEMSTLADETTKLDSKYIAMLREVAAQSKALVAPLRETVGGEGGNVSDPAAALKAYADRGNEIGNSLDALVARVDQFARAFPMVQQHPNWGASVQYGPLMTRMAVADVFQQAAQGLAKARLVILGAIDSKDPAQMTQAIAHAQRNVEVLEKNTEVCEKLLTDLANRLSTVDPDSKALMESSRSGKLFAERITAIEALDKQISSLPELKLGSIADRLKEENTVVVEANGKIRVLGFNDVFPVRESVGGPAARQEESARNFNGDSAISSALLALTGDQPVATVMLVSYEPPPPPQRGPFSPPPPSSWVPSTHLNELRKRLEAANFKPVDWNLATTKEEPKGEEGVPKLYVLLPPAPPSQPNPFGGQNPPEKTFGEPEREIIRKLLDNDAKALFVATWEVRTAGMFGGPPFAPPYGYGPLLEKDWGIKVENGRRVVWLEPDRQKANSYGVVPRNFMHMPIVGFTQNVIGAPMMGTRFLANDSCVLSVAKDPPKGVSIDEILVVPDREYYIGAAMVDLISIIDQVQDQSANGTVTLRSPMRGPFELMLAARRKVDDKEKGKIVVMGFGGSLRDEYLQQPVWAGGSRLRLDPPPTENADLVLNALYWLAGKEQWISRGPVPVPRVLPIEPMQARVLRLFVWGVWPALVFAPGIVLWYLRRR